MFRESLLETSAATVAQRGWATMMSFGLEMAGIATLIIVPLFIHQAVPIVGAPPVPPTTSVTAEQIKNAIKLMAGSISDQFDDGRIHAPGNIPEGIFIPKGPEPRRDASALPVCTDCVYVPGIPSMGGDPARTGLFRNILNTGSKVHATVTPATVEEKPLRLSHIDPGMLIAKVEPRYPEIAARARIQGTVRLAALIGKDGRIGSLHVLSGQPLLVPAALEAVSNWRYRPTMLNGQPVEVETEIDVSFILR